MKGTQGKSFLIVVGIKNATLGIAKCRMIRNGAEVFFIPPLLQRILHV